ncbi:hypothetical protein GNP59_01510 [Aliivibrio fischeri]|nr:hypothetical protein [Aliivibrio fischeri]MUL13293.1 hypothetical protein [Aliivibrio fischeri]
MPSIPVITDTTMIIGSNNLNKGWLRRLKDIIFLTNPIKLKKKECVTEPMRQFVILSIT